MNSEKIKAKYLKLHKALGTRKGAVDKDQFDVDHAKVWADCDVELKARLAEIKLINKKTLEETSEFLELNRKFR